MQIIYLEQSKDCDLCRELIANGVFSTFLYTFVPSYNLVHFYTLLYLLIT